MVARKGPHAPSDSKPTNAAEQYARFVETARKLECDEDKDRFEAKLGKIAKAKPRRELEDKKPGQ